MKIIIAGGAGYIGRHLYLQLTREGYEVIVWDKKPYAQANSIFPEDTYFEFDLADLANLPSLMEIGSSYGKDVVLINLAALKSVTDSVLDPDLYIHNNLGVTQNLTRIAIDLHWRGFIFASSAAVYGSESDEASENTPPVPNSPYGQIKLLEEGYLLEHLGGSNTNLCIFRFFNVVGAESKNLAEDGGFNLFPAISNSILTGTPLKVYGQDFQTKDGTAIRDYIDVRDLADAFSIAVSLISDQELGILNLGTGLGYTVNEVIAAFRLKQKFAVTYSQRRPGEIPKLIAVPEKAKRLLGWQPRRTLDDSIAGLYT